MDYEKIGKFIQTKRKELNLTQEELANKLSITDRAVSKWERSKGCPDISILENLATILNVSVLEILHGEKVEDENEVIIDLVKNSRKINIMKCIWLSILNIIMITLLWQNIYYYCYTRFIINRDNAFIVKDNNMINAIEKYDVVLYNRKYSIDYLKKGDLIVRNDNNISYVTRIKEIYYDENNERIIVTKADYNRFDDGIWLTIKEYTGKVYRIHSGLARKYSATDGKMPLVTFILYNTSIVGILVIDISEYKKRKFIII